MEPVQAFLGTLKAWAENASDRELRQAQAILRQEWERRALMQEGARSDT